MFNSDFIEMKDNELNPITARRQLAPGCALAAAVPVPPEAKEGEDPAAPHAVEEAPDKLEQPPKVRPP